MIWAVYSPSENRNVEMKNSNKSSIVRIIAALLLMSLLSCSKVAEPVAVPQHSNIFAKQTTSRIIIKGHQDMDSSKARYPDSGMIISSLDQDILPWVAIKIVAKASFFTKI